LLLKSFSLLGRNGDISRRAENSATFLNKNQGFNPDLLRGYSGSKFFEQNFEKFSLILFIKTDVIKFSKIENKFKL